MLVTVIWVQQNVGEAIWDGMQSIGKIFAEDVNDAINKAVDAVEDWVCNVLLFAVARTNAKMCFLMGFVLNHRYLCFFKTGKEIHWFHR